MSKLIKNIDLKVKKAFFKIKYLKYEIKEVEELMEVYISEFADIVREHAKKAGISKEVSFETSDSDNYVSEKIELSSNLKKAYRRIVEQTHPDKTSNMSKDEIEKRSDIFLKATKASEENSVLDIIECAEKIGVEIDDFDFEDLMKMHQEIEYLEKKILHYKNTYQWKWGASGKQELYIKMYLKNN